MIFIKNLPYVCFHVMLNQVGRRIHMVTMVMMVTRSAHPGQASLMVRPSQQEMSLDVASILLITLVFIQRME